MFDGIPGMNDAAESANPARVNADVYASVWTTAQYQPAVSVALIVISWRPLDPADTVPASRRGVPVGRPVLVLDAYKPSRNVAVPVVSTIIPIRS